ncbi:hypothetical protein [Nodularia chucula]|uniref:hypothetical protein n=1 Tax=Nodularia chucula TaxID=3093667 RepID=UPI0039C67821
MVHSFILPQETIASIQEEIKFLEECLNDPNVQDDVMAEILKIDGKLTSLSYVIADLEKLVAKVNKLNKLGKELSEKAKLGELAILLFVKYFVLEREIIDKYWYFFRSIKRESDIKNFTLSSVYFYKQINNGTFFENLHDNEKYILMETLKYVIKSLIQASLRTNALSEEEINALDLGDITPQESETMLISLASTKKWDEVYKNLA